jgi:hypothetical protein
MASSAIERAQSTGPGWIKSAFDGIHMSLDLINEKRIKIVVNGGAMNPKGLAEKVQEAVKPLSPDSPISHHDADVPNKDQTQRSEASRGLR